MRTVSGLCSSNRPLLLVILFLLIPTIVLANATSDLDDDDDDVCDDEFESIKCNPLLDETCLVTNPALGSSIFESFTNGTKYFAITSCTRGIKFDSNGLQLTLTKRYDNPALVSSFYIMYGKVEADIKGALGKGIISSFYLQSDDLDEIDIAEIFGGDPYEFQTNFFIKGNVSDYARGQYHQMPSSPLSKFHRYGVEWTPNGVVFSLDGKILRAISRSNKYGFPSSPMSIKFSLWAGGNDDNTPGTIAWAGGKTDYSKGPFTMIIKNVKVTDYSTGLAYSYGNLPNGKWLDLHSNGGKIHGSGKVRSTVTNTATIIKTAIVRPTGKANRRIGTTNSLLNKDDLNHTSVSESRSTIFPSDLLRSLPIYRNISDLLSKLNQTTSFDYTSKTQALKEETAAYSLRLETGSQSISTHKSRRGTTKKHKNGAVEGGFNGLFMKYSSLNSSGWQFVSLSLITILVFELLVIVV